MLLNFENGRKLSMSSKMIFQALQTGEISLEHAEKEIMKMFDKIPEQSAKHGLSGSAEEPQFTVSSNANQSVVALCEVEPGIVQLTMQDRAYKNAFSEELVFSLIQSFKLIEGNPNYKVVVLTGYDSFFCTGGTKEGLLAINEGKLKFTDANIYNLALKCKIPVIAAMQGHGIGAGWCLGMFCDFIIMSEESTYTSNYMKYGFTPGFGATLVFPEKFGISLAQEILFTGKKYHGSELKLRGIPFEVLPRQKVLSHAIQLAKDLSESSRESLITLKDHMAESLREKLSSTIEKELKMHDKTFTHRPEVKEKIQLLFNQSKNEETDSFRGIASSNLGKREEGTSGYINNTQHLNSLDVNSNCSPDDAIAVIGISGQFPKSKTLASFWDNIAQGIDCISEIPATRWSIDEHYDPDQKVHGKTYSKWMGVLEDADRFDSLFFNISPAEAELMDPQQRLFLENCWSCIEDAGLNPHSLSESRCGVFVGCATSDYGQFMGDQELSVQGLMGAATSILSARIAYFLNLKGPCLAIETACSSSLVAIAEACNSLILRTSDLALTGGVCVMPGPSMHIMTSNAGMLSADGRCFTFDARANGFVPGEGVGVVLLKRLSDAVRDHDPIYGVIRGWGINQDGKTNGITAPSVNSQIILEKEVYERFNINPETITLVEAHGTGTKLGDPIEVEALVESFQSYTDKKNYCALGSVKSNIGHLLTAAGVSGTIKILLALKHRMLPPTINFEKLNGHISLDNSPFYVNTQLQPWEAAPNAPRRAAVSSFGFSGTNAHLVIEEYIPATDAARTLIPINSNNPILFVLSAKNEERLKVYSKCMKDYIASHEDLGLADMAYTLQVGRAAMDWRLAFLADSRESLLKALDGFINDKPITGLLTSQQKNSKDGVVVFEEDEDAQSLLQTWMQKGKLKKIAALWVKGLFFDWNKLYPDTKPQRISLPAYPFAKKRYWGQERKKCGTSANATLIHPLLHQNTSDLAEQRFTSTFTGQEFFLADHPVQGASFLSGMACLEMARAAIEQATGSLQEEKTQIKLQKIIWGNPITAEKGPVQIHIGLYPEGDQIAYEIYSRNNNQVEGESNEVHEPLVHSRGVAVLSPAKELPALNLDALKTKCSQTILTSSQLYEAFKIIGLDYGPAYREIEQLYMGQHQILARLILPPSVSTTQDQFILHPSLMDAVFQASLGLRMDLAAFQPILPLALEELEIFSSCTPAMWAYIRPSADSIPEDGLQKLDMDLCNDQGRICVRMTALTSQENQAILQTPIEISQPNDPVSLLQEPCQLMTFEEVWQEQTLPDPASTPIKTLVCFLSDPEHQRAAMDTMQGLDQQARIIFISQGTSYQKHSGQIYSISPSEQSTYQEAFQSIREEYGNIDAIFYLWALEDKKYIQDPSCIVRILQAINSAKLSPRRLLLGAQYKSALDSCYLESWIGFERSLGLVLPHTAVAAVLQEVKKARKPAMKEWLPRLLGELQTHKAQSVLYQEEKRHVYQIRPTIISSDSSPVKSGAYLITGGCGGLGLLFAKHLAKTPGVNLVLTGRSPLDSEKQSKIQALEELGSQVLYLQADVCDPVGMKEGLSLAKEHFKEIRGLIHAAGIEGNQSILEKDLPDFQKVLDSKIKGTLVLDDLLQKEPLDFSCYFSSSAAILGDFGSCDYAIGNRFLMAYAHYRNEQQRPGKAIVINWPLWKDGGMGYRDSENTEMYLKSSGQCVLETKEGLAIFDRLLSQDRTQHLVLVGQPYRVHRFLGLTQDQPLAPSPVIYSSLGRGRRPEMKGLSLEQCLEWDLKEHISKLLKISRDRLDKEENLADFGFDSIMLGQFSTVLTNHFGIEFTPALFFGYSTIEKLTQYILTEHQKALQEFYQEEAVVQAMLQKSPVAAAVMTARTRFTSRNTLQFSPELSVPEPIAIIGMSGRFSGARSIDEMWTLLVEGQDMVKEIPEERFDWRPYYGDPSKEAGKTNCKWCGCIPGASEFDPLFFEISPREAETMDPRQRLLLQESWKALEDAGYGARQIKTNKIGMFVGVEQGDYQFLAKEKGSITSNHNAILAARLAYFLNLSGPVMALDTACSSSLVAAHQACQSLRNQECDTAIVAGINLLLTPTAHIMAGQAGMLSEDGKCFAFDKRANGMVPGEAVAVAVFKRLSQAEADKDPIYAVIQGSAVNYDGKTNGITAPSGVAQTSLLKTVYDQYRVNPEDIEHIVTHGTGTKLGDPVEINALYDAFKGYTQKQGYCALTSTKTNFGHALAASGLVSLIGLVQSLRHKTIPASLHCKQENDYINWKESPFYVNKTTRPWPEREGKESVGAVSAFGMSGTNAHMVVRSYLAKDTESSPGRPPYYLLALSAKTQESLQEKIQDMITVLQKKELPEKDLLAISYTLLEGRQHFNHRCAIVIQDCDDAMYVWKQIHSRERLPNLFQGKVPQDFKRQEALQQYAQDLLIQSVSLEGDKNKYQEILFVLADLYCQGYDLDWNNLYPENKPRRISLPAYPFAKEHYWVFETGTKSTSSAAIAFIHPLLHQNTSNLAEQKFTATFTGQEFFLADHLVKGQRVLPGVAYLEMARAALQEATGVLQEEKIQIQLQNIVWRRPITIRENLVQVHIGLYPEENQIAYEVYSQPDESSAEPIVHSQGIAVLHTVKDVPTLDLAALRAKCSQSAPASIELYEAFKAMGLDYGPAYRGIEQLYLGQNQVLARLTLPSPVSNTQDQFVLHPSMMDAALQASIGLMMDRMPSSNISPKPILPFALDELEVFGSCAPSMWAHIRPSVGSTPGDRLQKLDIDLCNDQGHICVRMKAFTFRILAGELDAAGASATLGTLMLKPSWKEQAVACEATVHTYDQHLVLLCEPGEISSENIETQINGVCCLALQSEEGGIEKRFHSYAAQTFEEIQKILKDKRTGKVLVQILVFNQGEQQLFSGLSGLLKTAQLENPKIIGQLIEIESGEAAEGIVEKLKENSRSPMDNYIRYQDNKRYVVGWSEVDVFQEAMKIPWKDQGVYLITGGAGGLGLIFAEEIVHKVKDITLILTGRSLLNEDKQEKLRELESLGARIHYKQVDVTQKQEIADLLQEIQEKFGSLHGIIHSAGVIKDNFILKKTKEELQAVLAPKVDGLVHLDQASKDLNLDFFVLFSSTAGVFGNPGQMDYAAANAFMDAYAKYRNRLVVIKQRKGQTISINWPLWKDGGMHVGAETEKMLRQSTGMAAMQTITGIQALYQILYAGKDQVMVMEGDLKRLQTVFLGKPHSIKTTKISSGIEEKKIVPSIGQDMLREKAENYFKKLLSFVFKLPAHRIEADAPLEKYGIDSVMVIQLTNQLETTFGLVSKTLFFEYQTIQELTGYFLEAYRDKLTELLGFEDKVAATSENFKDFVAATETVDSAISTRRRPRFASMRNQTPQDKSGDLDIAIIGVSGRYPGAENISEFWKNLRDGKDCITEIPNDRWDHSLYFDEDKNKPGKTYSKWGGFLDGVDHFDTLFFNISPREAEIMDPQERLFLECVYETLEDAGYTRDALGLSQSFSLGGNVGVFVGVMYEEYQLYGAQAQIQGRPIAIPGSPASIANRVSYFYNFYGPSMAVDTMCSSSLTAIHLACQSLQRGGCELAIAGGVNVSIHPNKYLLLGQGRFVSSKGRCESFGQGGDGYVPGEGVGAVLLKPLSKAIVDGDHIYGIIKATALNHGGKTNGYTVPNPNAQAGVIGRALKDAGINPRAISYIEAHGTGTSLGDPIEIAGLMKTFQEYTDEKQFCAIGSAKSNIGHCESAAGIAGLTKILLQLKYRQLVPSLHSEVLNPNIDFSNSPFIVQQELAEWKRPMVEMNGKTKEYPRIAGISSFGAGGSNSHVVIEEYIPQDFERTQITTAPPNPTIIILSAKSKAQLQERAYRLLTAINEQQFSDRNLADIAYTLQVGREAMEERVGLIVGSIKELEEKLKSFLEGQDGIEDLYQGQIKHNKEALAIFTADEEMAKIVEVWIAKRKYAKVLDLWVKGLIVDWNKLYGDKKPLRISLPTYPFAKEHYWIPEITEPIETNSLFLRSNIQFNDNFYDQIMDEIMNDTISIDVAVQKAKKYE
jgi:polyketide synthase PksN